MLMPVKLIVGLGNPGLSYAGNRHNTGFSALRHFAREHDIDLDKKQCKARVACTKIAGEDIVLARPQTYMNNSGQAVTPLAKRFNVPPEDIIVIHDDLDLPLGRIRVRKGGSSGGHNGVESIIRELGSRDFIRVRIGIGRPPGGEDEQGIIDFVLSDFTREELEVIKPAIARAGEAIDSLLADGLEATMNQFNKQ
jgi:peptidyl-tRNA hydrolase, PTH1 family